MQRLGLLLRFSSLPLFCNAGYFWIRLTDRPAAVWETELHRASKPVWLQWRPLHLLFRHLMLQLTDQQLHHRPMYWWLVQTSVLERRSDVVTLGNFALVLIVFIWKSDFITYASIAAGVGRAYSRICLSVCLFVCALTGKWLELSPPNLVQLYSIAVARHALSQRSKVKVTRLRKPSQSHGC